jgi:hypothetical protein
MTFQGNRLPSRFPVGTKLVVESRPSAGSATSGGSRDLGGSANYSRYLEFPDGTFFPLPSRAPRKPAGKVRQRLRARRG